MSLTDEQLMIAVGNGDMATFEQIVIRYQQFAPDCSSGFSLLCF